ncbi:MAG: hypothetical protein Q4F31_08100 [Eubacteriales bacterium]|nr:hypothetical protein [Eubacteriales bacterium]
MNGNNDFNFDDVFSDIFDSVYGEQPKQETVGDPSADTAPEAVDSGSYPETEELQTEPPVESDPESEMEFDPRFRLDRGKNGKKSREYSYGGHRVSSTQELDYSPNAAPEYEELKSSYGENEDYEMDKKFGLVEEEEPTGLKSKLTGILHKKQKETREDAPAEAADGKQKRLKRKKNKDIEADEDSSFKEEYSGAFNKEDEYLPSPSFKEYISSKLASVLLNLRGGIPADGTTGSANAEEEFLGEELDALSASKYYGSHVHSLRLRARLALILTAISIYLSLGAPAPGMLSTLKVATAACLAIEFTVMILSLDVITNAVLNCFRKKFGADMLAVLSAVISIIDALTVLNGTGVMAHMPLCSLTTLTLTGMLFSSLLSARGMRKALRVPAIAKKKYSVTSEMNVTGKEITILKSNRPITGFVRRLEEAPADEIVYGKVSIFIAALSLFLSILAALFKKSLSRIIYIYSVSLCAAVPFTALLCFALPYFMGSLKIFGNGAAMAGWSGIWDLGHSKNLIVTDTDVFPEECIEIENVRIFADYDAEKVISYAGSLILQSGCGLVPVFNALMSENNCLPVEVDNLEYLSGGGIKGMAEGNTIIVGGTDLMRLMNIRVPYRLVTQTSVLLSINGILYGIFNIKYKADPKVRKALVSLMRSSRHPVFALRDFNVTPEMLREHFDVATDGYDFPPYADRFRISEAKPSLDSQISAVVCREGLGPLTDVADTARKIYLVSMINTGISVLSSLVGMLFVFISILSSGAVPVGSMFIFNLVVNLPVLVLGFLTNTFE